MNRKLKLLCYLHFFVGIGALFGGLAGMLNPAGPLGIPVDLLEGSPFDNYMVPSIILFTVIGLGGIIGGLTAVKRSIYQGYISSVLSWALMIWIVVQCIIMNDINALHVFYFLLGLVGAVIAASIIIDHKQFPATLIPGISGKKNR